MKYTPEFKQEVCEFALKENILNAALFFDVHRDTVSKWLNIYKSKGSDSFYVKKKRKDKQKTKLNKATLLKIRELKNADPKLSLREIKNTFNLDCHISLISRKLSKLKENVEYKNDISFLYLFLNVLSQNIKNGEIYSLYQINLFDNNFHNHFIGFTSFKNNTNLCIFLDYVLSNIKGLSQFKDLKLIKTNIEYLIQQGQKKEFNRFIKDKYNLDIQFNSELKLPKSAKLDHFGVTGVTELFYSTYKKLITEKSINELKNNIIIPPIFIDDFIQDTNKIISFNNYWNILSLPDKQKSILSKVIEEIERLGDAAKINFDFDKALELYNKIYLTTLNCEKTEEVKANSIYKQADIYYHLDNFDLSKKMFEDTLNITTKLGLQSITAKTYYNLGMISYSLAQNIDADNYFDKSIGLYSKLKLKQSFEYHEAFAKKSINLKKYNLAMDIIDSFLALNKNNQKNIIKCYGLKGNIYFWQKDYKNSEKMYKKQKLLSEKNNDLNNSALSIVHLITIYTSALVDYKNVIKLLKQLLEISKTIKKSIYISDAYFRIGFMHYTTKNYLEAEKYLLKSLFLNKKLKYNYIYLSNLFYLGKTYYFIGKYQKSKNTFLELINLSSLCKSDIFTSYTYNMLGKIYFDMNFYLKSIKYFKKIVSEVKNDNNLYVLADSYLYLGKIHIFKQLYEQAAIYFTKSLNLYNEHTAKYKFDNSDIIKYVTNQLFSIRKIK